MRYCPGEMEAILTLECDVQILSDREQKSLLPKTRNFGEATSSGTFDGHV